jgi:hypothetical protein
LDVSQSRSRARKKATTKKTTTTKTPAPQTEKPAEQAAKLVKLEEGQVCIRFTRKPTKFETSNQYSKDQVMVCSEAKANYWIRRGAAIRVDPSELNPESEEPNGEKDDNPGNPDPGNSDQRADE